MKFYNFRLPTKLVLGCGSIAKLSQEISSLGKKVLLVTGRRAMKKTGILDRVYNILSKERIKVSVFSQVEPEPHCETIDLGAELAKKEKSEVIIGLGGGSSIDAAKAIAGIAKQEAKVEEFLADRKLTGPGLPLVAIPTTSGTGAEVTPNAVLLDKKRKIKKSFRSRFLFAKIAIIDPELTLTCPPRVTAYSGIDALTQAIESFVSLGSNPVTDSLCKEAMGLIIRSLPKVYLDGKDLKARQDMSYGSLLAGIALFNARMGAVHGLAHPLGARYNLAHGLLCGLLFPAVIEFNMDVVEEKYRFVSFLFGGETGQEASTSIRSLLESLNFPHGLKELGIKEEDFPLIAKQSMPSGSLKVNPKKVSEEDAILILKRSF